MDINTFKRVASSFADTKSDIEFHKGEVAIQVGSNLISAKLSMKEGRLWVEEAGYQEPAERWVVHRLARLPLLADRILSQISPEPFFVAPSASLLDRLDRVPDEHELSTNDALETAATVLAERPAGVCSILYLTSDAGEGKTTLINQLARAQAQQFKEKAADWLLIPISLGGRPFLRLDDVIVATLVNRLRFPGLFFEGFIELVRMGVIVPALDGFEEMFVQNASGEAVSALGNLIQTFSGAGSVLIAARKAYFEYRSFETQGRLFDALGKTQVSFARLSLHRWDKDKFLAYAARRGIENAHLIYNDIANILEDNHPLLTRAVLVRRLLDVAASVEARDELLRQLSPSSFFSQFVRTIIKREAEEKWLDRSGDPPHPLLSVPEHEELLSMVAQEMWENQVDTLRHDLIETVAEVFCENKKKSLTETRQIVDRVKQHALLAQPDPAKLAFGFDHEEFKNYYLGQALSQTITNGSDTQIRALLRAGTLPDLAVETCSDQLAANDKWSNILTRLQSNTKLETRTSFVRENFGAIAMRLSQGRNEPLLIEGAVFPQDSLKNSALNQLSFVDCTFSGTSLAGVRLTKCRFERCEFERLEIAKEMAVNEAVFSACTIHSISIADSDAVVFDPVRIQRRLEQAGFGFPEAAGTAADDAALLEDDEEIVLTTRVLRAFLRKTEINEGVLRARLGRAASKFFDVVFPELLKVGALQAVTYEGSGQQSRYRLMLRLTEIQDAISSCGGSFEKFIEALRNAKNPPS
jgi:hypothetical protein